MTHQEQDASIIPVYKHAHHRQRHGQRHSLEVKAAVNAQKHLHAALQANRTHQEEADNLRASWQCRVCLERQVWKRAVSPPQHGINSAAKPLSVVLGTAIKGQNKLCRLCAELFVKHLYL